MILIALPILVFALNILSPQRPQVDAWIPWTYFFLLLVIAADMKFGIYAALQGDDFCETKHFLYRRCVKSSGISIR
jgi:hypothetical protein